VGGSGGGEQELILATNGKAEIVLQHAASFQKLLEHADELEALRGIQRGLADVAAERVMPLKEFEKQFRRWHRTPRRSR
jgi:hypothetical protein